MLKNFQYKTKVYYEDTDAGGIVYYANYLKFIERARTEMIYTQFGLNHKQLKEKHDIIFVVNHKDLLSVDMSIKKNNNGNEISLENIKHSLNEIKSQFEDSFTDKTLIHMIINKYLIDSKEFLTFPQNLNCQIFSLDVTFISLSNNLIKELEIICEKYHISISKFVSAEYVKKISQLDKGEDIFLMTKKIIDGFNDNEVVISSKISRKKGFFERFFQLFG